MGLKSRLVPMWPNLRGYDVITFDDRDMMNRGDRGWLAHFLLSAVVL